MSSETGYPETLVKKKELRVEIKNILKSLPPNVLVEKSELVYNHLVSLLSALIDQNHFHDPKSIVVGGFAPMFGEVDWLALERDYCCAYPCMFENQMVFRQVELKELEVNNEFGVELKSPSSDAPIVTPDVLLIPGLSFSKVGSRLGRGKGFYDRYLEKYEGVKIGLCFSEQLRENVPCEKHDIQMDYITCDSGCFKRGTDLNIYKRR